MTITREKFDELVEGLWEAMNPECTVPLTVAHPYDTSIYKLHTRDHQTLSTRLKQRIMGQVLTPLGEDMRKMRKVAWLRFERSAEEHRRKQEARLKAEQLPYDYGAAVAFIHGKDDTPDWSKIRAMILERDWQRHKELEREHAARLAKVKEERLVRAEAEHLRRLTQRVEIERDRRELESKNRAWLERVRRKSSERSGLKDCAAEPEKQRSLVPWGWKPGGYMCRCRDCGKHHTADKRAWRCYSCAKDAARQGY